MFISFLRFRKNIVLIYMAQSRRVRKSHRKNARGGRRSRKMYGGIGVDEIYKAINAAIDIDATEITLIPKGKNSSSYKTVKISWDAGQGHVTAGSGWFSFPVQSGTKRIKINTGDHTFKGDWGKNSAISIGARKIFTESPTSKVLYQIPEKPDPQPAPAALIKEAGESKELQLILKGEIVPTSGDTSGDVEEPTVATPIVTKEYAKFCELLSNNGISSEDITINTAYRKLALKFHPDKVKGKEADFEVLSKEFGKFKENSTVDVNTTKIKCDPVATAAASSEPSAPTVESTARGSPGRGSTGVLLITDGRTGRSPGASRSPGRGLLGAPLITNGRSPRSPGASQSPGRGSTGVLLITDGRTGRSPGKSGAMVLASNRSPR